MKKSIIREAACLLTVILTIFLSVSCTTGSSSFNEEEATYVMNIVLETSIQKAITKTATQIANTETFIPSNYYEIDQKRDKVAGLDTLLQNWTDYARSYTLERITDFQDLVEEQIEYFSFADPIKAATGSNTSVTELFKARNQVALEKGINEILSEIDTSLLDKAVLHYNRWVEANNSLINTKPQQTIGVTKVQSLLASNLLSIFLNNMANSEELFRTTPQPDMESIIEEVLGLN